MSLLEFTLAVSVMFWTCAAVAELVLVTPDEWRLDTNVRVAAAYVVLLAFFAAGLKLLAIEWVWVLGTLLLAASLLAGPRDRWKRILTHARSTRTSYIKSFAVCLIIANLFLIPEHVAATYGPFTEGGGDVAIYADEAKYLVNNHLPAWGMHDVIDDLSTIGQPQAQTGDNVEELRIFDTIKGNPPVADYAAYRVANRQKYSSLQYSPLAQWFFLSNESNFSIFYGSLGFQYALLVLAIWTFLRNYGRVPAALGLLVVMSSHGLVSVFYNTYLLQGIGVTLVAIMLACLPTLRLLSPAGLRVYGLSLALMLSGYLHFTSVLAPLLLVRAGEVFLLLRRLAPRLFSRGAACKSKSPSASNSQRNWLRRSVELAVATITISMVLAWAIADATNTLYAFMGPIMAFLVMAGLGPLVGLSTRELAPTTYYSGFFGDRISPLSEKWLSFVFGHLSQQHYQPFADLPRAVARVSALGTYIGLCVVAIGALVVVGALGSWIASRFRRGFGNRWNADLGWVIVVYVSGAVGVFVHLVITQTSLYVQAKGAQNVLVLLYAILMVLPFAFAYRFLAHARLGRVICGLYGALLLLFAGTLAVPRIYFGWSLARESDRSTILESSYFDEAKRIQQVDGDAMVLVEPKKSSDVYFAFQPFFGGRVLTTRHLSLSRITGILEEGPSVTVDLERDLYALDFLNQTDLPHLWLLAPDADSGGAPTLVKSGPRATWHATRPVDADGPQLLLSGNNYERFYARKSRSSAPGDEGWFTYLNGGIVALVLPDGDKSPHSVSLRLQPGTSSDLYRLLVLLEDWFETAPSIERGPLRWANGIVSIDYQIRPGTAPRLIPLVRYPGEFLVNVRLDARELKDGDAEVLTPGPLQVGAVLTAEWRGLQAPQSDDWIGVFAQAGPDDSRVAWGPTGGGSTGSMAISLPRSMAPGTYELRLFSHGTWLRLATSEPFAIQESTVRLAVTPASAHVEDTIVVEWSQLASPSPDDWFGLFPADGADDTRIAFVPTGGGATGDVAITLPPSASPGEYELRLYTHGSWQRLATAKFRVVP
jgi:hypothetical protein